MPADYCGGFTIDNIDQFGTLEQINVSFDDPVWNSATTCIYYGDASITASASVGADGDVIRNGIASISCTATVVSDSIRIRTTQGFITASGSVSADAIRLRTSSGQITGVATVTALGGVEYSVSANIDAYALLDVNGYAIRGAICTINGTSFIVCDGHRLGDNWAGETPGSESWVDETPQENTWVEVSSGFEDWTPVTPSSNNWTDKSIGTPTWQ
jgi:hypothetical protein